MRVTPRLLDGMTTELEGPFIELRPGSEMAKWVKALAAKPSDLSSISGHTRWRARTVTSCPLTFSHALWYAHAHTYNKYK